MEGKRTLKKAGHKTKGVEGRSRDSGEVEEEAERRKKNMEGHRTW